MRARRLSVRRIGYGTSDGTQLTRERVENALRTSGCSLIFIDDLPAAGTRWQRRTKHRAERERALNALRPGDILILHGWHTATVSLIDGIDLILAAEARTAAVKCLDGPAIDFSTADIAASLPVLSRLSREEHARLSDRAAMVKVACEQRGTRPGPGEKVLGQKRSYAKERYLAGDSVLSIARTLKVSHSTIKRVLLIEGLRVPRRARLTPEQVSWAVDQIQAGAQIGAVARALNVARSTLGDRLNEDRAKRKRLASKRR